MADEGGVGLDDAAGALAVDDGHDDGARVRAGELGAHRHPPRAADAGRRRRRRGRSSRRGGVVDDEVAEGVGVVPRAVPRVEAVGDDVGRLADAAHGDDGREGLRRRAAAPSGSVPVARRLALRRQLHPEQDAVVVRREGEPVAPRARAPRARPCQRQYDLAVHHLAVLEQGTEVRAGAGPGEQAAVLVRARARPRGRRRCGSPTASARRRSRRRRRASRPGRAAARRGRTRRMRAGRASRHVPARRSRGSAGMRRKGLTGRRAGSAVLRPVSGAARRRERRLMR